MRSTTLHFTQIERPLQKHGGRLDQNEPYCGTCYGAEDVCCPSQNSNCLRAINFATVDK